MAVIRLLSALLGVALAAKPHVLFIVIDDLGFDDVNFRSHQIQTPHINKLASEGMIFSNMYLQDVCSPSRSSIQSGRYAMHHGVVDWIPPTDAYGLMLNDTTMAEKMLEAGYDTHAVGKWHMGFYKWAYTPTFRGFNSFLGFYSGGEDYFQHTTSGAYDMHRDASPNCGPGCSQPAFDLKGTYSTTAFTDQAVKIINNHSTEQPLFLYLAYQAVHAPAQVPPQYEEPYAFITDSQRRTFAGMLACLDEGIGNVTAALEAQGMLDDTLIVFTTDNGGPVVGGDAIGARNYPLRGGKHSAYEGGVRGTAFVRAPSSVTFPLSGGTYDNLMHAADWLPTMCDAVGVDCNTTNALDGVSHWQQFQSSQPTQVRDSVVIGNSTNMCTSQHDCGFAYRKQNWKLLRRGGGEPYTWTIYSNLTGGKCNVAYDVCCPGNDLISVTARDVGDCCGLCQNASNCTSFTFRSDQTSGNCYLKHALSNCQHEGSQCTSGSVDSKAVPHAYLPVDKTLLFDVEADIRELKDASDAQPDVVEKLSSELDQVLESYFAASNDPACPFTKWPTVEGQGPIMVPWC
eukprot:TRINITY_DN4284_c0_g1_i1.p1 TRINITY_DN4284_c0_g1~~TRINITY_DN4284_c0_g1_i1.p1  ORF type:complete len:569 (+),score=147.90 TRINITY_DN4284_c0_g1_i1:3-1709(+)